MNDDTAGLGELLRSPTFWIGTVVVGLLLNVAGHFIATRLEKTTSGAFEAFRKGSARRAKKIDEQARRLTDHPGLVTVWASQWQCLVTVGLGAVLATIVLFLGAQVLDSIGERSQAIISLASAALFLVVGFAAWIAASRHSRVLVAYLVQFTAGAHPRTPARAEEKPEGRRPGASEYRKAKSSATWHFCLNCSGWPVTNFEVCMTRPGEGELCNECKAKDKDGTCKTR